MARGLLSFNYDGLKEILRLPAEINIAEVHTDSLNKIVNIVVEHESIPEMENGYQIVIPMYRKVESLILDKIDVVDPTKVNEEKAVEEGNEVESKESI
jgi:hypothetical protein